MKIGFKVAFMGFMIGVLAVIISIIPAWHEFRQDIELEILFRVRGSRKPPSDVVILSMDKLSDDGMISTSAIEKWPRSIYVQIIDALVKQGAAIIAFDIIFSEPHFDKSNHLFAKAIANAGNVLLCQRIERGANSFLKIERLISPIPILSKSAVALAPFPLPKTPVKLCQYWTFKASAGDVPTLPVVAFQLFTLNIWEDFMQIFKQTDQFETIRLPYDINKVVSAKKIEQFITNTRNIFIKNPQLAKNMLSQLQNSVLLDNKKRHLISLIAMYQGNDSNYINFYGCPGTIATIHYHEFLQNPKDFNLDGKVIFVGFPESSRIEQRDNFYTVFSQANGSDISGVEVAATAFANLVENMPIKPLSPSTHLIILFLWGATMGAICRFFSSFYAVMCLVTITTAYGIFVQYQFNNAGVWYPIILPLFASPLFAFFGALLWRYHDTEKDRQNIKKAFGHYIPDKVVDRLAKNISDIKENNQIVYGTCLFTDAQRYSTLSEIMKPEELGCLMNNYYDTIFKQVKAHGGNISDIVGDAMLAIWASNVDDPHLRAKACMSTLDIACAIDEFNQSLTSEFRLPTRIGLHSGSVLLGNIGAIDHYEYTPIGDVVNTASRIEGLNKYLGTKILVSEDALCKVDGFLTRKLGKFLLAGKSKPIAVLELICRQKEASEKQIALCKTFAKALEAYNRRSFKEAIEILHESMKNDYTNGPSQFYLTLCQQYIVNPPSQTWDGLISLKKK